MRRRGYTPEGIRLFTARIGVDKANSRVSMELLEDAIRDDLNARAPRVMAVLRPLKVTITDWPAGKGRVDRGAVLAPRRPPRGIAPAAAVPRAVHRAVRFQRGPARRLDAPAARRGGAPPQRLPHPLRRSREGPGFRGAGRAALHPCPGGRRRSGGKRTRSAAIQWVSAAHAVEAEVRLYDRLFTVPDPEAAEEGKTFKDYLNPDSVGGAARLPARAGDGGRASRRPLPVRAARLLHRRRRRLEGGRARVQPDHRASGHLQGGAGRQAGNARPPPGSPPRGPRNAKARPPRAPARSRTSGPGRARGTRRSRRGTTPISGRWAFRPSWRTC